jgi:hypothetical protein
VLVGGGGGGAVVLVGGGGGAVVLVGGGGGGAVEGVSVWARAVGTATMARTATSAMSQRKEAIPRLVWWGDDMVQDPGVMVRFDLRLW